jgi:hypothetical protein
MGRERGLSTEVMALLARGHYGTHSVLDIVLSDGTPLHYSTAEFVLNGTQYLAKLHDTETLKLSRTSEIESIPLDVDNVDESLGITLTGETNMLDGATGRLGIVFIDTEIEDFIDLNIPLSYYDEKLSGDITSAALDDKADPPVVSFTLVNDLDSITIVGKTVVEMFPVQTPTPPENRPVTPNDLPDLPRIPTGGGGITGPEELPFRRGRNDIPFNYTN